MLYLSDMLIKAPKHYMESKSADESLSPALFNAYYSGEYKKNYHKRIKKIITKYLNLISSPGEYSPHKLRSTLASKLLKEGHDLYYVSKILNHKSINTTKIYLTAEQEKVRDIMTHVEY